MDILKGLNTAPWLVGLARAILLAIVGAVITWLGINAHLLPGSVQWAVPLALLVLRQIEALFDQQRVSAGQVIDTYAGRPDSGRPDSVHHNGSLTAPSVMPVEESAWPAAVVIFGEQCQASACASDPLNRSIQRRQVGTPSMVMAAV